MKKPLVMMLLAAAKPPASGSIESGSTITGKMMRNFMSVVAAAFLSLTSYPASGAGLAVPDYPKKPIRLISPFPPGGGNDTMARAIGAKLAEAWGQQIVVDNGTCDR